MAYFTKRLFKKAIEAIKKKQLVFHYEVEASIGCSTSTYYEHFPKDSEEYKEINDLLTENKISIKQELRTNWRYSDSPTLQVGLMKLLATNEERKALSQSHIDVTTDGEQMKPMINVEKLSMQALLELKQLYIEAKANDSDTKE